MNRHHPYGSNYDNNRRGGSPTGAGPERVHGRFHDRGAPRGRGGRGRGGRGGPNFYGSTGSGGGAGYEQSSGPAAYEALPDPYNQWNSPPTQDPYFAHNTGYPSPYGAPPGGFDQQHPQDYGSYEEGAGSRGGPGGGRGKRGAAPRRERDDKVHDSLIEQRIQRERPCRTLFIRNIKYETDSDDVRRKFEEHGEIKTFFDLISNRGMVFVTYYDLRAAERARERLQDTEISGRPIDVHYSLPRSDDSGKDGRDRNQGTLLVTLRNSPSGQPIDDNEVRRKFQQFGDVKNVKTGDSPHHQRYVEFFDVRACEEAHDRLRHQGLQDGVMEIVFAPDIPDVPLPPGPLPPRRTPEDRPYVNRDDEGGGYAGRARGRGGFRGRGRGAGPSDDWERRRDDWAADQEHPRRYDDDFDRGGRGRGGYNDSRGPSDYNSGPPTNGYGSGPISVPPPPPPIPYGGSQNAPPPPPVDERLEQARRVQQLLEALKPSQGAAPLPGNQPGPSQNTGQMPPPTGPISSNPTPYYPPPPQMHQQPPPYSNGPPMANPYGAPPPMQSQPAPNMASAMTALGNLPPNIMALLQQATQASPPPAVSQVPPPMSSAPPQYGMPPQPHAPMPPAPGQDQQAGYQQLVAYLQSQANNKRH